MGLEGVADLHHDVAEVEQFQSQGALGGLGDRDLFRRLVGC